jgi:YHS domain-containing protein
MAQVKDPVCGMMIDDKSAVGTSEYNGKPYYFCSQDCKTEFDENPDEYADKAGSASGGSSGAR